MMMEMSSDEYDEHMYSTFDPIFDKRHLGLTGSCMYWGFEVGPGWRKIVNDACVRI